MTIRNRRTPDDSVLRVFLDHLRSNAVTENETYWIIGHASLYELLCIQHRTPGPALHDLAIRCGYAPVGFGWKFFHCLNRMSDDDARVFRSYLDHAIEESLSELEGVAQ